MEELGAAGPTGAAQDDLELRLARLWAAVEMLDRYSWRVLEGVDVDADARAALAAAYTSATTAAVRHDMADTLATAVRSTLVVLARIDEDVSWAAKRWLEYATTALVCRPLLPAPAEPAQDGVETRDGVVARDDDGVTDGVTAAGDVTADAADDGTADDADDGAPDGPGPVLVGGDFGWAEYEVLTFTWRKVVGELHPDDPPLVEEPADEDDDGDEPTPWWAEAEPDATADATTGGQGPARPLAAIRALVRALTGARRAA